MAESEYYFRENWCKLRTCCPCKPPQKTLFRLDFPPLLSQLSSTYPSLNQLEKEAETIARILDRAATAAAADNNNKTPRKDGEVAATIPDSTSASAPTDRPGVTATAAVGAVRVPGAFSEEPELRRRAVAAARKLTPEEERRLRAGEVQRAVSSRDVAGGVGGGQATTAGVAAAGAEPSPANGSDGVAGTGAVAAPSLAPDAAAVERSGSATCCPKLGGQPTACEPAARKIGSSLGLGGGCSSSAPPPRRRPVKVAPAVLALLTKQHTARAIAVAGAGESTEVRAKGEGSAAPAPFAVGASATGSECPSAETSSAGVAASAAVPVAASAKPMSKTLAALLARRADRPPPSGPARCGGGGDGDENEARKKATPPPLGFLGELKARAAAAAEGTGTRTGPERGGKAALPTGGSFLDELKAKTARIS